MARKREIRSGTPELFAEFDANYREASIDEIVAEQKQLAKEHLLKMMNEAVSLRFIEAVDALLQAFMLRETNLKDVCVELAREGQIKNSWGGGPRKPSDQTQLILTHP
jgi:hypothetical protein